MPGVYQDSEPEPKAKYRLPKKDWLCNNGENTVDFYVHLLGCIPIEKKIVTFLNLQKHKNPRNLKTRESYSAHWFAGGKWFLNYPLMSKNSTEEFRYRERDVKKCSNGVNFIDGFDNINVRFKVLLICSSERQCQLQKAKMNIILSHRWTILLKFKVPSPFKFQHFWY